MRYLKRIWFFLSMNRESLKCDIRIPNPIKNVIHFKSDVIFQTLRYFTKNVITIGEWNE